MTTKVKYPTKRTDRRFRECQHFAFTVNGWSDTFTCEADGCWRKGHWYSSEHLLEDWDTVSGTVNPMRNQSDWVQSFDPAGMLRDPCCTLLTARQLKLLCCAHFRLVWAPLPEYGREALECAELRADSASSDSKTYDVMRRLHATIDPEAMHTRRRLYAAHEMCSIASTMDVRSVRTHMVRLLGDDRPEHQNLLLASVLRDIAGNPFQGGGEEPGQESVTLASDRLSGRRGPLVKDQWRTKLVCDLAEAMYQSGDFAAMRSLGDALADAGCDDVRIVKHCHGCPSCNGQGSWYEQSEGHARWCVACDGTSERCTPHVRGCWVVDQILKRW